MIFYHSRLCTIDFANVSRSLFYSHRYGKFECFFKTKWSFIDFPRVLSWFQELQGSSYSTPISSSRSEHYYSFSNSNHHRAISQSFNKIMSNYGFFSQYFRQVLLTHIGRLKSSRYYSGYIILFCICFQEVPIG